MASTLRLFVNEDLQAGQKMSLEAKQAHYLLHVMRKGVGALVLLFNGRDGEWWAEIQDVTKKSVRVLISTQSRPQQNTADIWLMFAPVKRAPIDQIAQKATELGVACLWPVKTERTIVTRVNETRLRANAIEAAEQSDRLDVPEIRPLASLMPIVESWPARYPDRHLIFCDEAGKAPSLLTALSVLEPVCGTSGGYAFLIGPEGGFTPGERAVIRAVKAVKPVSLGARILRADTAALAALSVFQAVASA